MKKVPKGLSPFIVMLKERKVSDISWHQSKGGHYILRWTIGGLKFQTSISMTPSDYRTRINTIGNIRRLCRKAEEVRRCQV